MGRAEANGLIAAIIFLAVAVGVAVLGLQPDEVDSPETDRASVEQLRAEAREERRVRRDEMRAEHRAQVAERLQDRYPQAEERLVKAVVRAAYANDVNVYVLASMAQEESSWRTDVVSYKGAIGLLQVKLSTAHIINPYISIQDLKNPWINADVAAAYLRRLRDRHNLSWEEAVRAYNAGPTRARRNQEIGMGYTQRVHRRAAR